MKRAAFRERSLRKHVNRLSAIFAILSTCLPFIAAQASSNVYECPITRGMPPDPDPAQDKPLPLPSVDPGSVTSAEFGTLDHPFTTSAAYGARYNTVTSNVVESSAPTKNMPYVWLLPRSCPTPPLTWWRLA